ncbi:nucleoside diphosphate kinase -like protein [Brachionus plicatilis]|uniref:Nucleoside diphosphate kinase homolog 5 n=1 Tax=Brachionus plicatilis TaxID=10195 RepID=A0A3M7RDK7_BRAPC|nr:nucleoside diphosphate kinase -like protein [Brachionus plicatilis]
MDKDIHVQRTLAIIKPDAVNKAEEIEDQVLRAGFSILNKRWVHLSPEQCSEFYSDHSSKIFFPSLVAFMSSGPIVVMELAKENAISSWRNMIGNTNSEKARAEQPDSIRAKYGRDEQCNAVHGSDSELNAEREIRFFFSRSVIEPIPIGQSAKDYLENKLNPTVLKALTQLCKEKPQDPVTWLADWLLANNPYKPLVNSKVNVIEA